MSRSGQSSGVTVAGSALLPSRTCTVPADMGLHEERSGLSFFSPVPTCHFPPECKRVRGQYGQTLKSHIRFEFAVKTRELRTRIKSNSPSYRVQIHAG